MGIIVKIRAEVVAAVPDGSDLNDVGAQFDNGLLDAVSGFPGGDVIDARVDTVARATQEEIDESGWSE